MSACHFTSHTPWCETRLGARFSSNSEPARALLPLLLMTHAQQLLFDEATSAGNEWPIVMDKEQVAAMLRLRSGNEALKQARSGFLPSVRVGRHVLFLRDEVVETLRRRQRPAVFE